MAKAGSHEVAVSEKIPCTECGAMIRPLTAELTGGICMSCKKGIRKRAAEIKEQFGDIFRRRMEYDPIDAHWSALIKKAHHPHYDYDRLSDDEKPYFSLAILAGEVRNGGVQQFFTNSSGSLYSEVVKALDRFGHHEVLRLFKQATRILFEDIEPPKDRMQRWEAIKHEPEGWYAPRPQWSIDLDEIDKQLCKILDALDASMNEYADSRGLYEPFKLNNNEQ